MIKTKKTVAILLALALCFALAACGESNPTTSDPGGNTVSPSGTTSPTPTPTTSALAPGEVITAPDNDDVTYADSVKIILESALAVIDPLTPGMSGNGHVANYRCLYDRLIVRTPEGVFLPELAKTWETSDSKTFTFTLRDDVTFHNGQKFTAQDVVDTALMAKDSPGSLAFDSWRTVDTATVVDEYTVRIVLGAPNADFLFQIARPGASIINKAAREADPVAGAWVGTGAFYMSGFASNDYQELTRNDNYWGDSPTTRQITFQYIPELAARTIMMLNDEAQVCVAVSPEDMHKFRDDPDNFHFYSFVINVTQAMALNMNDPITGDLNFRLAVAHAMNSADIAMVASGDLGVPLTDGSFWGHSTEFRNSDIPLREYDLDLAKQYLAASSYNGEEVELMAGVDQSKRAAEYIAVILESIGIKIKLFLTDPPTVMSTATYGNDVTQLVVHSFAFTVSASSSHSFFAPNGAGNRASYFNQEVVDLLALAPTLSDRNERAEIYKQVQTLVAEDVPFINLFYRESPIVCGRGVGGIVVDPDNSHDYRYIFQAVG